MSQSKQGDASERAQRRFFSQENDTSQLSSLSKSLSTTNSSEEKVVRYIAADSGIRTNPFEAATIEERDENFPSFDQALNLDQNSSVLSCSFQSSVALSISARAALNEHNRHVARHGIDNSFTAQYIGQKDSALSAVDPYDVEWDRLLVNTNNSVHSNGASFQLFDPSIISPNRVKVETDVDASHQTDTSFFLPRDETIEGVRSEQSISNYFNTSAVHLLRTPEGLRFAPQNTRNNVTVREARNNDEFRNDLSGSSDTSSANESTKQMQNYLKSMGISTAIIDRSKSRSTKTEDKSCLLSYVDLSHISADGSDGGDNVEVSFSNNESLIHNVGRYDHFIHLDDELNSSIATNKTRDGNLPTHRSLPFINMSLQHSSPSKQGLRLTPRRINSIGSAMPTACQIESPHRYNSKHVTMDMYASAQRPPRTPNRGSPNSSQSRHFSALELSPIADPTVTIMAPHGEQMNYDHDDDARLAMIGLSPVSKQAAESAINILQSNRQWKAGLNNPEKQQTFLLHTSDDLESTERKNDSFYENYFNKASISTITPNSSSEHHVTTKQAISSSSFSRSSDDGNAATTDVKPCPSLPASSASPSWCANDRRRYRTVVPLRVFLSEPNDFPNEDDSFANVSSPMVGSRLHRRHESFSVPSQLYSKTSKERRRKRFGDRSVLSSPH